MEQTRPGPRPRPSTPAAKRDTESDSRAISPWRAVSPLRYPEIPLQPSPPSPNLEPHARQDSPSPYTMTPRNLGTPRKRAAAQLPPVLSLTETHFHQPSRFALAEFQQGIQRLASEIDALKKERHEWRDKLDTDSEVSTKHSRLSN